MAPLSFSQRQRRAPAAASSSAPSPAQPIQRVAAPASSASSPITIPYSLAQTPISPPERPSQPGKATGLPAGLKAGIKKLSGISLDEVRVHYHSQRPARLGASAYTQGEEIHLAPGQQRHLPHEAWHVVQQKQRRVRPTLRLPGLPLNDSPELEQEARVMGARAATAAPSSLPAQEVHSAPTQAESGAAPVQMNNEYLKTLAKYLGVGATFGAVAYALGITTTALATGLSGLGGMALYWSAPKLIGYIRGRAGQTATREDEDEDEVGGEQQQEAEDEGSSTGARASSVPSSSQPLTATTTQTPAKKKKRKRNKKKAQQQGEMGTSSVPALAPSSSPTASSMLKLKQKEDESEDEDEGSSMLKLKQKEDESEDEDEGSSMLKLKQKEDESGRSESEDEGSDTLTLGQDEDEGSSMLKLRQKEEESESEDEDKGSEDEKETLSNRNDSGSGGWKTTTKKKKNQLNARQKQQQRNARSRQMRGVAEEALRRYNPRQGQSTICVFLDSEGKVVTYGESGWSREGRGKEITQHLSNFVVQQKSQRSGYGGIQCAEPEAILDANRAGKMHQVAYSLAYDQKSRQYKSACGSCEKYLNAKGITDLHYH